MKNCVVKMIVKNKNRTNPQDNNHSDIHEENSLNQTLHRSKTTEEKDTSNLQLKNLLLSFQKIMKSVSKPNPTHEIEARDRKIIFELPETSREEKITKRQLEAWITDLCKEVFSTAFHYYEKKEMSYDQAKIYCSENMISNIIRLNQVYNLNSDDIKTIDDHINTGVTEYLLTKYPMTQINIVNKALEASVKETDNIQALENDIFFYSDDSFGFQYRETANYNDKIMRLMNFLMTKTDSEDGNTKMTLYEGFYEFIQKSFELIQSRDFMDGVTPPANSKGEDLNKKVEDQKYKSRVKAYTSWAIGRKISQNVSQYTQEQINSMHMPIKSPAILRILTKWCEELWAKFNKKNYFLDRTENVKCQKGKNVNTYFAWMKTIINDMIEEQKIEIQKYMDQLLQNNYSQQETHFYRSLRGNHFTHVEKYEKAAGIFTINIVNNLHSYILLYLNRLIHGLLKVSKRVYDKELIGRARWTSPPNLISFKIGDLMRCKIGSQQRQILKLFKHFSELSEKQPLKFKIIRIKNRLKEGTNDILMNIRYKDVFICQIQLGVNSDHSNFIKCSNKYNHFIYEVKRSIFGPITEFSSIWKSLDGRCKIYEKMAVSRKQQTSRELKSACQQNGLGHSMQRYNQPFVCSKCHQTYSHSNYIWSHQQCQKCNIYAICCKCRIAGEDETQLKDKLFKNNQELKSIAVKMDDKEEIPKYGVCFPIESKYLHLQKFVKWTIKGKVGLYYRKEDSINLITDLNSKKEMEAFKDQYVIFKLPVDEGVKIVRISELQAKNEYLLPKLVKSIYKKQKEFISLIGQDINDTNIAKILNSDLNDRNKIKFLELPDNNIENISFICDKFRNLTKLVLSRNKIKQIDEVHNLINLEQLNIRDNVIEELPQSLFKLFKLTSLNIRNNKCTSIPQEISKLTNLTKIEMNQLNLKELPSSFKKMTKLEYVDLTKNKLGLFPEQLKPLKALVQLGISSNGIQVIPNWIGDLKELKVLELNKNKLKELPACLSQLSKLTQLQIENNLFEELKFACPESMSVILANKNKIKSIDEYFFVRCKYIVKIELNDNLIENLPKNFGIICSKMKNLSLNNNKLTDLPNMFGIFLPSIELLELKDNQIKSFPKALKNCSQLIQLHLSGNPLEGEISDYQFLSNNFQIEKLDFSRTNISRLPNLSFNPSLKRLNFSQTNLRSQHLQILRGLQYVQQLIACKMNLGKLPQSIKELSYLHILDLSNNQLELLEDNLFEKLTHLRQLTLDDNSLDCLPSSIRFCKKIKIISCNNNKFTSIPEVIYSFAKIQKIFFENNQIANLQSKQPIPSTIKELHLTKNKISSISNLFFKDCSNLKTLDLSYNQLTAVPRSLRECLKLSDVNFNGNKIVLNVMETTRQILQIFAIPKASQEEQVIPNNRMSLMQSLLT